MGLALASSAYSGNTGHIGDIPCIAQELTSGHGDMVYDFFDVADFSGWSDDDEDNELPFRTNQPLNRIRLTTKKMKKSTQRPQMPRVTKEAAVTTRHVAGAQSLNDLRMDNTIPILSHDKSSVDNSAVSMTATSSPSSGTVLPPVQLLPMQNTASAVDNPVMVHTCAAIYEYPYTMTRPRAEFPSVQCHIVTSTTVVTPEMPSQSRRIYLPSLTVPTNPIGELNAKTIDDNDHAIENQHYQIKTLDDKWRSRAQRHADAHSRSRIVHKPNRQLFKNDKPTVYAHLASQHALHRRHSDVISTIHEKKQSGVDSSCQLAPLAAPRRHSLADLYFDDDSEDKKDEHPSSGDARRLIRTLVNFARDRP